MRSDSYNRAVSRLDIFSSLSGGAVGADGLPTAWKGCVEARADGYDVDDTPPGQRSRHALDALPVAGRRRRGHDEQ